MYDVNADR